MPVATGIVAIIIGASKFTSGAWVSILVIGLIIMLFKAINRHYVRVSKALEIQPGERVKPWNNTVVVLVGRVHKGVLQALQYAKSLNPSHLLAVCVVTDEEEVQAIQEQWVEYGIDVPLETVFSPYRELSRPVLRFIDELDAQYDNDVVTVIIPEFVVKPLVGAPPPQPERAPCSRDACCSASRPSSPRSRITSSNPFGLASSRFQ